MPQGDTPAVYRWGIGIVQGTGSHGDLRPCLNKEKVQVMKGEETIITEISVVSAS